MASTRKHTVLLWLLFAAGSLWAQEGTKADQLVAFFKQRAREDAKSEQLMRYTRAEDDRDYWADQLNFEKALKKHSYTTYKIYLIEKRSAYAEHKTDCNASCKHSLAYFNMAAFYEHYGRSAKPYRDPKDTPAEPTAAIQKNKS